MTEKITDDFQATQLSEQDLFKVLGALNTVVKYSLINVLANDRSKTSTFNLGATFYDIMDSILPYQDHYKPDQFIWQRGISPEDFTEVKELYSDFPRLTAAFEVLEEMIDNPQWKQFIQQKYSPAHMTEKRDKLTDVFSEIGPKTKAVMHSTRCDLPAIRKERERIEAEIYDTPHEVAILPFNQS